MRTVSTIFLTVTLLVSAPAIAAPIGLVCLATSTNRTSYSEPLFLVIDVEVPTLSLLTTSMVDVWRNPHRPPVITVDKISWILSYPNGSAWELDRKTLILENRVTNRPNRVRPSWDCDTMSEQELRSRASQYQQELQEGNRI